MMKLVAFVPMKGHSERVKDKNIRRFNDKPLFWYILHELSKAKCVDEIVVDTDSERIETEVKKYFPQVNIVFRPEELQGDFVSMNEIIKYDMSQVKADAYLQTHVTNPLLQSKTIEQAYEEYKRGVENGHDSLFSVDRLQTRLYRADASPLNHNPKELIRTQDLEPLYNENSNMYFFTEESFQKANARIGCAPMLYEMNPLESMDIDEVTDFVLAEQIYRLREEGKL